MDKYISLENIGDGTYGAVYKATNTKNSNLILIHKMNLLQ